MTPTLALSVRTRTGTGLRGSLSPSPSRDRDMGPVDAHMSTQDMYAGEYTRVGACPVPVATTTTTATVAPGSGEVPTQETRPPSVVWGGKGV